MDNGTENKTEPQTTVQTEQKNENQEENIHLSHVKIKRNNQIILLPFGEISDFEKYYKEEQREKAKKRITPAMKTSDRNAKQKVREAAKILEELVFDYKIDIPPELNDRIFKVFETRFKRTSKVISEMFGMLDLSGRKRV